MEHSEEHLRDFHLLFFKHQLFCIQPFTSPTNPKVPINTSPLLVLMPSLIWSWLQLKVWKTSCTQKLVTPSVSYHPNKAMTEALSNPKPFYNGAIPKTFFNIFFASALYSTTQSDEPSYLWWGLTALFYPLSALKTVEQVNEMPKLVHPLYRGLLPFMALNYLLCWQLTGLFGEEKGTNPIWKDSRRDISVHRKWYRLLT